MTRKHPHTAVSVNRRREQKPDLEEKIAAVSPPTVIIEKVISVTTSSLPITVVCVNYKTEQLTEAAIQTFRNFYPEVKIVLVDNHSQDKSTDLAKQLADENDNIVALLAEKNIGHGPAMNWAIRDCVETPYAFLLDSDTETIKGGFLELMIKKLETKSNNYAIGWLRHVNTDGVAADGPGKQFTPYVHPYAALIKLGIYYQLPVFEYHGAPCLANMTKAKELGYTVLDFPIQDYVKHLVAGTRRMWKGAWDVRDKEPTKAWSRGDSYPI